MSWEKYDIIRPQIIQSLKTKGFKQPTGIQSQVLESYKHYYDFLLASQTGSGKTLAFGIPILSDLINYKLDNPDFKQLSCLILTPTRELALQIQDHLNAINPNSTLRLMNVVGGLSKQKQLRLISYRPDILIATPGRLNQLLESQNQIICLDSLRFLVIDEADRMVELGHFKEVDNILNKIFNYEVQTFDDVLQKEKHKENSKKRKRQTQEQQIEQQQQEIDEKHEKDQFKIKNKNIKFDINSLELDKLIQLPADAFKIFNQQPVKKVKGKSASKSRKHSTNSFVAELSSLATKAISNKDKFHQEIPKRRKEIKKKIFLVSATLTKQFKDTKYYTKKKDKREQLENEKNKNNNFGDSEDLAPKLKALISRITFTSKPKIIDLSGVILIPKLLEQYVCYCEDENQKLAYLLCYLTEKLKKDKKVIIFANTIKVSKRLSQMLTLLKHPNQVLHSFMQQRQRLAKLDNFSKGKSSLILISTDLAARGLDMVIDLVIQYGVPTNGDTYVHRLGRTARAGRNGENLIIVGKDQYNRWKDILKIVQGQNNSSNPHVYLPVSKLVQKHLDQIKIAQFAYLNNRVVSKQQNKAWLKKQAEEVDIILDDDEKNNNKDDEKQKAKKQIKKIHIPSKVTQLEEKVSKWRKNRFVMDPSDIQSYLTRK